MYALTENSEIVGPVINGKINGKLLTNEILIDNYKAVSFLAWCAVRDNFTTAEIVRGLAAATGTTIKACVPDELAPLTLRLAIGEMERAAK